jgi:hypothetical protein
MATASCFEIVGVWAKAETAIFATMIDVETVHLIGDARLKGGRRTLTVVQESHQGGSYPVLRQSHFKPPF